jgi:magnesium-transporting ATPase (P-type)
MDLVRRARAWSSASTDTNFSFGSVASTTPLTEQASSRTYYEPPKKKKDNSLELLWKRWMIIWVATVKSLTWRKEQATYATRTFPIVKYRTSPLKNAQTGRPFITNTIRTARYTFWDFLPRQLVAQFSKLANFYFLFVAAIQLVPSWSPTGRYTTLLPLAIFTSIAMAHEGYDDWRRSVADKQENAKTAKVLRIYQSHAEAETIESSKRAKPWLNRIWNRPTRTENAEYAMDENSKSNHVCVWQTIKWSDLQVGDYVMVEKNQWIPADLILLHSPEEQGMCYLETAGESFINFLYISVLANNLQLTLNLSSALDGETNHKSRQANSYTNSLLSTPEDLAAFEGMFKSSIVCVP